MTTALSRRRLFGVLPLPFLPRPGRTARVADPPAIPAPDPSDQLARLADHFGRLYDALNRLLPEYDRLAAAGDVEATDAWEDRHWEPLATSCKRAERALMEAMSDRNVPLLRVGPRLFVSTCFGPPWPDAPFYVLAFDLADPSHTDTEIRR